MVKNATTSTPIQTGFQFVVGRDGKATAVLLDISTWEHIVHLLEDLEDTAIAKQFFSDLEMVNGDLEKAGYISWGKARAELEVLDEKQTSRHAESYSLG